MSGQYAYTPYIWPMLASAMFFSALGIYAWRRRAIPGALPFSIMLLFMMLWSLGATLEIAAVDLETMIFWFKFQGVMKLPAATAELCFGLQYAGLGRFLTRRNLLPLSIPPLLVFILALTNDSHHLLWLSFRLDGVLQPLRSTLTFTIAGYSFVLALVLMFLFIGLFVRSPQYRWPAALILAELLIARTAVLLDYIGMNPFAPMDPVVLVWNLGAPMYALALFGFRMFDPLPLARKTVIEQMQAGMLVLDLEGRVISLNPAAKRILNAPAKQVKGKLVKELLPAYPEKDLAASGETEIELGIGEGPSLRYYMLRVWPLNDFSGLTVGLMLLLTDVTGQKRAQAQLMEQQRALATLQEREHLARELHDSLGQTLAAARLQASTARVFLAEGETAKVDDCLGQVAEMTVDAEADVREYLLGARIGFSSDHSFFQALREYAKRFSQQYGLQVDLSVPPQLEEQELGQEIEIQFMRIIQEALSNVRKHARANNIQVIFTNSGQWVRIVVTDDGQGFDLAAVAARQPEGFGLQSMRERAESLSGSLEVVSQPGLGTTLIVHAPIHKAEGGGEARK